MSVELKLMINCPASCAFNCRNSVKLVLMKNLFCILFFLLISAVSCSKRTSGSLSCRQPKADYDTVAVDSFSTGAISVDVAEQIRMSSRKYQDSLKEALKLQEQEKKLKKNWKRK